MSNSKYEVETRVITVTELVWTAKSGLKSGLKSSEASSRLNAATDDEARDMAIKRSQDVGVPVTARRREVVISTSAGKWRDL